MSFWQPLQVQLIRLLNFGTFTLLHWLVLLDLRYYTYLYRLAKKSFMSSIEATVCPNSESIYILNPKLYSDTEKAIFGEGYNFNKLYLTTRWFDHTMLLFIMLPTLCSVLPNFRLWYNKLSLFFRHVIFWTVTLSLCAARIFCVPCKIWFQEQGYSFCAPHKIEIRPFMLWAI